jgi:hypothetical protein
LDPIRARQPLPAPATHLQARCAVDSMHALVIHCQPFALKEDVQPAIAKSRSHRHMRLRSRSSTARLVALVRR